MTCENGFLCRKCNFPRSAVYNYPYLIFSACKRSENFINFICPVGDILSYRMYSCFEVSGEFCQFQGNKANWCSVLWLTFFLRQRSCDLLQRRISEDFMRISVFSGSKLSFLIFSSYGAKAKCFIAEWNEAASYLRKQMLHLKRRFMKHGFAVWSAAYAAWSGTACHEAKPWQASCFFCLDFKAKKMGCKFLFPHLVFTRES